MQNNTDQKDIHEEIEGFLAEARAVSADIATFAKRTEASLDELERGVDDDARQIAALADKLDAAEAEALVELDELTLERADDLDPDR